MEVKDPMVELLSSLEQIVLTRNVGDTFSAQQEKRSQCQNHSACVK